MADNIEVKVGVDTKDAQKGMKQLGTQTAKLGKGFKDVGKLAKGALGSVFSLKGAIAAAAGAFAVGKLVEAANVQEDAINSLNTALKITGKFSEGASESFQEYASSLQAVTKFGDEAILQNAALIQQLGNLDEKGLKRATKASLDMAAALNVDLNTAANLVAKAAGGMTSSLSRYGIQVQKGKDNAESFANALGAIEEKFGGSAQAQVKTFSGALQQTQNTFGDLLEEMGFLITRNPVIIQGLSVLSKGFGDLITIVKDNAKAFTSIAGGAFTIFTQALGTLGQGVLAAGGAFLKVKDVISKTFDPSDFRGNVEDLKGEIADLREELSTVYDRGGRGQQLQSLIKEKSEELEILQIASQNEVDEFKSKTDAIKELQEGLAKFTSELNQASRDEENSKTEGDLESKKEATELAREAMLEEAELRAEIQSEIDQSKIISQKEFNQKMAELGDKERVAFLKGLKKQLKTDDQLREANSKKRISARNAERAQFLIDEQKFGTTIANFKKTLRTDEVQGVKSTAGQLAQLQQSSSKKQQAIGKAAALVNIGISTAEGAIKAFTSLSGIPLVGPALGAAAAAALIAFGTEQASKVAGFAEGGVVTGGISGKDSVPIMAQRGEIVAPRSNFDEVIGSVRAKREADIIAEEGGGGAGGLMEVVIGFADNAFEIIEEKLIERQRLGISTL